jgi:hypothetical protein
VAQAVGICAYLACHHLKTQRITPAR